MVWFLVRFIHRDTVRPALQIIKTKPGISRTSGVFLMNRESTDQRFMFADCAINIDPNAQELSEIALNTADTARIFDIDPKIAMLSFSTKGSAKAPQAEKVREATQLGVKDVSLNWLSMVNCNLMPLCFKYSRSKITR